MTDRCESNARVWAESPELWLSGVSATSPGDDGVCTCRNGGRGGSRSAGGSVVGRYALSEMCTGGWSFSPRDGSGSGRRLTGWEEGGGSNNASSNLYARGEDFS